MFDLKEEELYSIGELIKPLVDLSDLVNKLFIINRFDKNKPNVAMLPNDTFTLTALGNSMGKEYSDLAEKMKIFAVETKDKGTNFAILIEENGTFVLLELMLKTILIKKDGTTSYSNLFPANGDKYIN